MERTSLVKKEHMHRYTTVAVGHNNDLRSGRTVYPEATRLRDIGVRPRVLSVSPAHPAAGESRAFRSVQLKRPPRIHAHRCTVAGSTTLLSTPIVSNTKRVGSTAATAVTGIDNAKRCWGRAIIYGDGSDSGNPRRRRASLRRTRQSSAPLRMMAGECVGGTDVSRVLFVCLYNIITRYSALLVSMVSLLMLF